MTVHVKCGTRTRICTGRSGNAAGDADGGDSGHSSKGGFIMVEYGFDGNIIDDIAWPILPVVQF